MGKHRADRTALLALLLEAYRLDPGAIQLLVEEATSRGPQFVTDVIATALGESLSLEQSANLADFVRRACTDTPSATALSHSIRRKGRCPKSMRSWLRTCLTEPASLLVTGESEQLPYEPHVLDLSDSSWTIDRIPDLLDRLGQVPQGGLARLDIKLGPFTYASALAVIAQWILANKLVQRTHLSCPDIMQEYLDRVRFPAALRNREIIVSPDFMDWAVGLTRINHDLPTEKVTDKIVDIIDTFISPDPTSHQALQTLIAEMIENVHRHAQANVDGFAVAQVYPRKLKLGITLVDAGIGVRTSLEQGEQPISLSDDAEFLRKACQLHVTSKPSRHSGYGLYLLSEVIARNRGTFAISSGKATLTGYLQKNSVRFETRQHRPWHGTIVTLIIDLGRLLPILDVYRSMPAQEGYTIDDLFIE